MLHKLYNLKLAQLRGQVRDILFSLVDVVSATVAKQDNMSYCNKRSGKTKGSNIPL